MTNHSYLNTESVCLLLRAVADAATLRMPITLVLGNARDQKRAGQRAGRAVRTEVLYLPPYSPNLNLIKWV